MADGDCKHETRDKTLESMSETYWACTACGDIERRTK